MAITLILPYFPGETGVSAIRYSEDREPIESEITLTETDQPGMYSGSIAFDGPSYQSVHIYSDGASEPYGFWAIAVTADNTTADYAESIGELKAWAATRERGQVLGQPYTWTNQAGDSHTVTISEAP